MSQTIEITSLSPALLKQLMDMLRREIQAGRTSVEHEEVRDQKTGSRFPFHVVITDEAMDASSFLAEPTGSTDPSVPNATVCLWSKAENKYEQTSKRLAVSNHSSTDHEVDTPGVAFPVNGHYIFFGDCEPLSGRPDAPWEVA